MLAKKRADQARGGSEQAEHQRAADHRNILVGEDQFLKRARALGDKDPETPLERVEAKHVAERLGDAEQAGDYRKREIE